MKSEAKFSNLALAISWVVTAQWTEPSHFMPAYVQFAELGLALSSYYFLFRLYCIRIYYNTWHILGE